VDALGFNQFLSDTRDEIIQNLCKDLGAEALPRPVLEARAPGFTPASMMNENDGLHPKSAYGTLVLDTISRALA
jgi:hypothetical protein